MTAKRISDLLEKNAHKAVGATGRYDRPDTPWSWYVNELAVTVFFLSPAPSLALPFSPYNSGIIRGHFEYQIRQPGAVSQNNDKLHIKVTS